MGWSGSAGGYLQAGWPRNGGLVIAVSLTDCATEVFLSADNDLDRRSQDGRRAGVHLAHGFRGLRALRASVTSTCARKPEDPAR
jgi:hypothetical protein